MKLIVEDIQDVEYITEEAEGKKSVYIVGPFLAQETVNKNGRFYPASIMEKEVARYTKECIENNCAYGELGHPTGPGINLDRVSHMIKELRKDGDHYIGKAKLTETPMGNIARSLILEGARLGVSSRGMGSLKADEARGCQVVQDDFRIAAGADIVADPSGPGCFVRGIMEGAEFTFDPSLGEYSLQHIEDTKKVLSRKTVREIEESALSVWRKLMAEISGS